MTIHPTTISVVVIALPVVNVIVSAEHAVDTRGTSGTMTLAMIVEVGYTPCTPILKDVLPMSVLIGLA